MNPRQRRGVLLLVLGGVGAVLVFVAIASFVAQVQSSQPNMTRVWRLADTVPAFAPVRVDILEDVEIPEDAVPPSAVLEESQLQGVVAANELGAGSILQNDMLVPSGGIRAGQREIAILVSAETGVAYRVQPGSRVDIYASFEDQNQRGTPACAGLLIAGADVVSIGRPRPRPARGETGLVQEAVPVTFALSPANSRKLVYAESFASEVRLALRAPGDRQRRQPTSCVQPPGVS